MMKWLTVLSVFFTVFAGTCLGFQCHVCSYSATSDSSTDCIFQPELLTAPSNYVKCTNGSCFIQENYSLYDKRVDSFMRTCSPLETLPKCTQDTWHITCIYTCLGDLCNSYAGHLHEIIPINNNNNQGGSQAGYGGENSGGGYYPNTSERAMTSILLLLVSVAANYVLL